MTPFKGLRSRLSARSVLQNACGLLRSPLATRTSALLLRASCPKWTARPVFSVGHFAPLISLRSESGCHLGNLIFNDLEALQVESSAHFDHLIFTEWARRVTDKTEVLKMITPVASLQMKSSYHFDNLILIRLQSSSQSGNLIRQELQIKLRKA